MRRAIPPPDERSGRADARAALLAAALLLLVGCSSVRLRAPGHPGVADRSEVVWSYAWGLVPAVIDGECQGQALAEVTVRSPVGYDLLAVVTFGLVAPKKVEWRCAGATPSGGTIPTPSPAGDGSRP